MARDGSEKAMNGEARVQELNKPRERTGCGALAAAQPRRVRPPPRDAGAYGIRIARDGTWYYQGSPIRRKELVCLFASVLKRDAEGGYILETPAERGRVEVEDAPFVAVELARDGAGVRQKLRLRTNLDEWLTVGEQHRLEVRRRSGQPADAGPVPYVEVRAGLEARLARPVYYELVELGVERQEHGEKRFGVWSDGRFFALDLP
jgi:uncharacterized protein